MPHILLITAMPSQFSSHTSYIPFLQDWQYTAVGHDCLEDVEEIGFGLYESLFQLLFLPLKRNNFTIKIYHATFTKTTTASCKGYTTQNLLRITFFDIAYLTNDTPVRGPHKCVLKLLICHVHLALIE